MKYEDKVKRIAERAKNIRERAEIVAKFHVGAPYYVGVLDVLEVLCEEHRWATEREFWEIYDSILSGLARISLVSLVLTARSGGRMKSSGLSTFLRRGHTRVSDSGVVTKDCGRFGKYVIVSQGVAMVRRNYGKKN